jgi:hypothetical protein
VLDSHAPKAENFAPNRCAKMQRAAQTDFSKNNMIKQQILRLFTNKYKIVFIINTTNVLQRMNKQTNKVALLLAIPFPPLLNEIFLKLKMCFTRPNGMI